MHVEICEKCRWMRLVLMTLLIVFAALAGYHWGNIIENLNAGSQGHGVIILGVVFSLLALMTALWVETIVTRTEMEAALAQAAEEAKAEEALAQAEQARELDRIVSKLSDDNKDLRYMLMSRRVHEVGEELATDIRDAQAVLSQAS